MVKHIMLMSLWQAAIIFTIVFEGQIFIQDDAGFARPPVCIVDDTHKRFEGTTYVYPGIKIAWEDCTNHQEIAGWFKKYGSRHMTVIFTVFVFMQIFNMICARKINDELNIFDGVFSNPMFVIIVIAIAGTQVCLTQFTGLIFKCATSGKLFLHF